MLTGKRYIFDRLFKLTTFLAVILACLVLGAIFISIFYKASFNWKFFTHSDSTYADMAGILGGLVGSLYVLAITLIIAVPMAVMSAIYLEELAPNNKFFNFIEITLNNLAAVPSIIIGLLGLAIYISYFHLPRSSALVGGMTLALLIIPGLIITTRQALSNIPNSQREAVIALGASHIQMITNHLIPLALPGIITGIILSICRTIGETAALLMIGMVAFITHIPQTVLDPATVLPVQIYMWSENFEPGFAGKTAAAIILLLVILMILNYIAARIRRKYDYKW